MKLIYKGDPELKDKIAYQTSHSTGLDLICQDTTTIRAYGVALIGTGLYIDVDANFDEEFEVLNHYLLYIVNRSSTFLNTPLIINNSPIDVDYRDEIRILARNIAEAPYTVTKGSRIAQLVVAGIFFKLTEFPTIEVKRQGGMGSTG